MPLIFLSPPKRLVSKTNTRMDIWKLKTCRWGSKWVSWPITLRASFHTNFPCIFQWSRWASHVNESFRCWWGIWNCRCPWKLLYLVLKILQGADGITEIKVLRRPPKVITNAALETERRERTGCLGTAVHQKLCVNSYSLKGCQSLLRTDEMNFEI